MTSIPRDTGISDIGALPWGSHICQVYKDKQDLLDILIPYFKAGLESNEYCIWITTDSLSTAEAESALRLAVPDLDSYIESGQLEIIPHTQWYLRGGSFDPKRTANDYLDKLRTALENGYEGMRLSGDASWLCGSYREAFSEFESAMNRVIALYPIVALCTYPFESCGGADVADVMANHEFTLMEGHGRPVVWENPEHRETRQALKESNERLELLSEATASLLSSSDPASLIRPLAERVMEHFRCDVFFNYLAVPGEEYLQLNAYAGIPDEEVQRIRNISNGEAVCSVAGDIGKTIVVDDIPNSADSRADLVYSYGVRTYACIPLISHHGALLGTLSFGTKTRSYFEQDEIDLIQTVARQIATALEHKRSEDTLKQSESRFRALFDNSPDAIFLTQPEGIIKAANPAACAMFGMTEEEIRQVGRSGLVDPDDPRHAAAIDERRRTGSVVNAEATYKRKNGQKFPAEVSSVVLDGDPPQAFVVVRDITRRKRAEDELRQSEAELKTAQSIAQVGSWYWAADTDTTAWSEETYRITGTDPNLPPPRFNEHAKLYTPEAFERLKAAVEDAIRSGVPYELELDLIRPSGEIRHVVARGRVVNDESGRVIALRGTLQDVTERKQTEAALRASEERLARTQQFSMVMPIHVSLDGRWLKVPPTFVDFLGFDKEEDILGHEFKEYTHPDDFQPDWDQVQMLLSREIKSFEMEKRFVRKDGSITWGYLNCSVVTDEHGNPVHLLTYVRDINKEKRIEQEREDLLRREQRIAETLQQALVPPDVPSQIGDYRIAVKYRPALKEAEVGGDFYDVFDLGEGKIAVLIGDVVGKGLAAAIRVAAARYSIRGYAYLDPRPGRVLELANDLLCKDRGDEADMLTAFLAVIDTGLGTITYAGAGHEPPVVMSGDSTATELRASGMPLGVIPGRSYEERSRRLDSGDRIVMVTDGITEARTEGPVLFEKRGINECLKQTRDRSAEDTANCVLDNATEHAGGQLQDDAAILVVDRMPSGGF